MKITRRRAKEGAGGGERFEKERLKSRFVFRQVGRVGWRGGGGGVEKWVGGATAVAAMLGRSTSPRLIMNFCLPRRAAQFVPPEAVRPPPKPEERPGTTIRKTEKGPSWVVKTTKETRRLHSRRRIETTFWADSSHSGSVSGSTSPFFLPFWKKNSRPF